MDAKRIQRVDGIELAAVVDHLNAVLSSSCQM